ncbi:MULTISPECIES: hypothetical protein [unclassified Saccharicrinis]|uniref:hypothetical protein n=1 Tax=unclassified Saccharicrinis TaxID=2646859 RepID=UPI003D349A00
MIGASSLDRTSWQKEFRDAGEETAQIKKNDNINIPENIFTIPRADFLRIEKMIHIGCDFSDILQFNVTAYFQAINKKKVNIKCMPLPSTEFGLCR